MRPSRVLGPLIPGLVLLAVFAVDIAFFEDGADGFDARLLLAFRLPGHPETLIGPAWMAETGRDLTGLGSNGVLGLIVLTTCGGLLCLRRWRAAATLVLTSSAALIVNGLLKLVVQRARPGLIPDTPQVFTTSFPSSHAMMSAAVFFTLASLVATGTRSRDLRVFAFVIAAIGTGLVGASRLYLGVHWPTDVVGGWAAGLFCAWASWRFLGPREINLAREGDGTLADDLQRPVGSREVEPDAGSPRPIA